MSVLSAQAAWRVFVAAILLLAAIAYWGDRSAERYASSEAWVSHTREVEAQISSLRAAMAVASAAQYEAHVDPTAAARYRDASGKIEGALDELQSLTRDNPVEQDNLARLRPAVEKRMQLIGGAVSAPLPLSAETREALASESLAAAQTTSILEDMRSEEEQLLASRTIVSEQNFSRLRFVLGLGLLCVFGVLMFAFRTLLAQLSLKDSAERSVRKLSAHILRIQDAERRRLARELHDGLGQIFAGLNMEIDLFLRNTPLDEEQRETVASIQKTVAEGLSQTRTISYLLHPPMLDEFGFEQAAKWYVEGFSARSKIDVALKFSQSFPRLPEATELVLFRIIQEALTNVHRHSGSARAEICASLHPDRVNLVVRDSGNGIPPDTLKGIEESSTGAGVGLGGMRERVAELGGYLTIESNAAGTVLNVSLPFATEQTSFTDRGPSELPTTAREQRTQSPSNDFDGFSRIALET